MAGNVNNAREALVAQLLEDIDGLVSRLENVQGEIAGKIEQSTKDAAGKAFLAARLSFETMIRENERKLIDAGRYAAAQIGIQFNAGTTGTVAANQALTHKGRALVVWCAVFALVAGIAGGFDAQSNIRRCAGRTATGSKIHGL